MQLTRSKLVYYRKAVMAAVVSVFAVLAYAVVFDPALQEVIIATIGGAFNVGIVFYTKNHSPQDVEKAASALAASFIGLLAFFMTVDPSVGAIVAAVITGAANVYGVWKIPNEPMSAAPATR
jgi:hypothetical protein